MDIYVKNNYEKIIVLSKKYWYCYKIKNKKKYRNIIKWWKINKIIKREDGVDIKVKCRKKVFWVC